MEMRRTPYTRLAFSGNGNAIYAKLYQVLLVLHKIYIHCIINFYKMLQKELLNKANNIIV